MMLKNVKRFPVGKICNVNPFLHTVLYIDNLFPFFLFSLQILFDYVILAVTCGSEVETPGRALRGLLYEAVVPHTLIVRVTL